jgi:hypothetical protein
MKLAQLIAYAVKLGVTEVRLVVGKPPVIKVGTDESTLNVPPLTMETIESLLSPVAGPGFGAEIASGREREIQFDIKGLGTVKGRIAAGSIVLQMPDPSAAVHARRSRGIEGYDISLLLSAIVLLGIGFARLVFGTDLIPESWRFENYAQACLLVGTLLIILGLARALNR